MTQPQLCFIGAGNMARSLIGGMIADGYPTDRIRASDPEPGQREAARERFGIEVFEDNSRAIDRADVVILAVKPQRLHPVVAELAAALDGSSPLFISIAAGVPTAAIDRWLGGDRAIVRCMPNTPALVQSGATALYGNPRATERQRNLAESILRAVGLTLWVEEESLLDAVTALSGSGPAYLFLMIEAMEQGGEALGLAPETARLLALQTAFGAARMALESPEDAAQLRAGVTSPGGTTEQALAALEAGEFRQLIQRAMQAARDRSRELASRLGSD